VLRLLSYLFRYLTDDSLKTLAMTIKEKHLFSLEVRVAKWKTTENLKKQIFATG
jgi:hypothetical protein